jgi:hypothetical protein
MQEAVSTVEREGSHLFRPGQSGNPAGKPKGTPNRVSKTIREAVLEAVQPGMCHPEGLKGWLVDRAQGGIEDRKIFAAVVSRVIPIEITGEGGGPVKIDLGWLTGRKVGGEVIDITPTQSHIGHTDGGDAAAAGGVPDLLSDTQAQAPAPLVAKRSRSKARKGESE